MLSDTIAAAWPLLRPRSEVPVPVETLADAEVLALGSLELEPVEDRQLSELLERQQDGSLTEADRATLAVLLQSYQAGLLRKARGLPEAGRRGSREPLSG